MVKKILLILTFPAFMLAACNNGSGNNQDTDSSARVADSLISAVVDQQAFDSYSGILPCADCEGIETTINLHPDSSYEKHSLYLSGGDTKSQGQTEFNDKGIWIQSGDTILLTEVKEHVSNKYLRTDSSLIMLDRLGHRIEGVLADAYVLKKK